VPLLAISLFFYHRNLISGLICAAVIMVAWYAVQQLIKKPESETTPSQRDLIDLLTNKPWLMILGLGFLTMLFNGIKYGVIAYYFNHYIGEPILTGRYFIILLTISIVAAFVAGYLTRLIGKKALFAISLIVSGILTSAIYFIPVDGFWTVRLERIAMLELGWEFRIYWIYLIGGAAEFFAAFMPVLIFSMLGDAADFSEWKHNRRATGLFYSAGTFIQKTGGGFAGAMVLIVLASYGYVGTVPSTIAQAEEGMILLMSWIPAVFAFVSLLLLIVYPLNTKRMGEIEADLTVRREQSGVSAG